MTSWDAVLAECRRQPPGRAWSSSALVAEREVAIDCDDDELFDDFFAAFGGSPREWRTGNPACPDRQDPDRQDPDRQDPDRQEPDRQDCLSSTKAFVSASILAGNAEFGYMRLRQNGQPHAVDDVFFGLTFPDCPFEWRTDGAWTEVSMPGEPALFVYRDDVCLFRKSHAEWRSKLLSVLYRGSLRLRDDVIFFHASALSVRGRGVVIVGRKMSGKSTTSLALAARGHAILADSCACYEPATGKLIPFRRPVGIREGPRSQAVDAALARGGVRGVHRDASFRVDLDTLLPGSGGQAILPVPDKNGGQAILPVRTDKIVCPPQADAIFFLRGFAPVTRIEPLKNDASELANLRPIGSSFANAPHTQRVFELIRLLSRARLYGLWPGHPDETAKSMEETLA